MTLPGPLELIILEFVKVKAEYSVILTAPGEEIELQPSIEELKKLIVAKEEREMQLPVLNVTVSFKIVSLISIFPAPTIKPDETELRRSSRFVPVIDPSVSVNNIALPDNVSETTIFDNENVPRLELSKGFAGVVENLVEVKVEEVNEQVPVQSIIPPLLLVNYFDLVLFLFVYLLVSY